MKNKVFTNRYEIKYLIDPVQYLKVKKSFAKILVPDINANYYVQSIYFDSLHYRYYNEKHEGLLARTKPRLRMYRKNLNEISEKIFLEFKNKYDKIISKDRTILHLNEAKQILNGNLNQLNNTTSTVLNKFKYLSAKHALKPAINIFYHREAYFSNIFPNLRITYDSNIKSSLSASNFDISTKSFEIGLNPTFKIMEIKYNNTLPLILLKYIQNLGLISWTFSKYTSCLERNYDNVRTLLNFNFNSLNQGSFAKTIQPL